MEHILFRALNRLRVPDPAYYWLLDRLTDNNGWRPLHMRACDHWMRGRVNGVPRSGECVLPVGHAGFHSDGGTISWGQNR